MYDKEIYEKSYYYELDRKDKIASRLPVQLSLMTLIGGAIANFLPSYLKLGDKRINGIVDILVCISIGIFIISIYFAIKSYSPKKYGNIPSWAEIDLYESDLKKYYENDNEKVQEDLDNYYIAVLKNAKDMNFLINNERLSNLARLNTCLCIEVPLIMII